MELTFWGGPNYTQVIVFAILGTLSLLSALTIRRSFRERIDGSGLFPILVVISVIFFFVSVSGFDAPVW